MLITEKLSHNSTPPDLTEGIFVWLGMALNAIGRCFIQCRFRGSCHVRYLYIKSSNFLFARNFIILCLATLTTLKRLVFEFEYSVFVQVGVKLVIKKRIQVNDNERNSQMTPITKKTSVVA